MVNIEQAKRYCCDDISQIENYNDAIADEEKIWHCHHKKETTDGLSKKKLIELGLYYKQPSNDLVFLPPYLHKLVHLKGKKLSDDHRKSLSIAHKGKRFSKETREKMSNTHKEKNKSKEYREQMAKTRVGHIVSEETRSKISEANRKPKQKCVWMTPDYSLVIMDRGNGLRCHPDWIIVENL